MSSKQWIDQVVEKRSKPEPQDPTGKRAWLAEMLMKMRKEKG